MHTSRCRASWLVPLGCGSLVLLMAACGQTPVPLVDPSPNVTAPLAKPPSYSSVLINGVPHVQQRPDFCGEAVTESWLMAQGSTITQDQVFALSGMNPERGMGATTRELAVALARLGFETGAGFETVPSDSDLALNAQFAALHADLRRQIPSIVCMRFDESPGASEHFRLVLGYDATTDEVVYHEPARPDGAYQHMARRTFLSLWPLKYTPKRWTVIRLRLTGTPIRKLAPESGITPAAYAQHIMSLRRNKARGFPLVLEPPFVVLGDNSASELRTYAQRTVRWAVTHLKRDFFAKDPNRILDIWLFGDNGSYERNANRLFGSNPTTPFGYYSSEHDALVMNIATGGGTLVHEIVHPFIETNFPACPAWFNEGMGSLFEQAAEREGHIVGLTNWRLAGLKRRIERRKLPSFATLLSTTAAQFYNEDIGSNYGQARYLLYYLQERGLLRRYYHEFVAHQRTDPTGLATLKRVLNEPDIAAFQQRWEQWVLSLQFAG